MKLWSSKTVLGWVASAMMSACLVFAGSAGLMRLESAPAAKTLPVEASLHLVTPEVSPDQEFLVAIDIDVKPGWHMGPIGDPNEDPNALAIQWVLPEGFALKHLSGPNPVEHHQGELSWRGYVDHVQLIAALQTPKEIQVERVSISAEMDWVACGTSCIPGSSALSIEAPARKQLLVEQTLAGAIAAPEPFIPSEVTQLLSWLGLAFLGGVLLNLMPCVLPVLSLKAVQLVHLAREGRKKVIGATLAYAAGVISSFLALGLVFILFKGAGTALGWGFQLQSPAFVGGLSALLLLLSLSMMGFFEMGTSVSRLGDGTPRKHGLMGSFLSGILTTLVATPCTGPFLGSALAFGMTLSAWGQMAIMSAMALGLVSPFLLLVPFPGLLSCLPKPGRWMEKFKIAMGVLLAASAGWLVWIFAALTDDFAWVWWCFGLAIMSAAAWWYGRFQWVSPAARSRFWRQGLLSLSLVTVACFWQGVQTGVVEHVQLSLGEKQYSREKADQLLGQGRSVLVDFTARWCLLCQANKPVLHSEEVQSLLEAHQVAFLEADLTRRSPELMQELARLGREGVPAYVLLTPGKAPLFLPEVITADTIREVVAQIPTESSK
jgi:thiol:disulfide interchange protein